MEKLPPLTKPEVRALPAPELSLLAFALKVCSDAFRPEYQKDLVRFRELKHIGCGCSQCRRLALKERQQIRDKWRVPDEEQTNALIDDYRCTHD